MGVLGFEKKQIEVGLLLHPFDSKVTTGFLPISLKTLQSHAHQKDVSPKSHNVTVHFIQNLAEMIGPEQS
jgi:hypothetical protein